MRQKNNSRKSVILLTCFLAGSAIPQAWGDVISEDYTIYSSDGQTGDEFGSSVATSNGLIVVGSPLNDENGINAGAAYIYNAANGAELHKLLPIDGTANAEFGYSVSISNGIVAVGARMDEELGSQAGAAYLFDAATGAQLHKLLPDDGATGDEFGNSIAIDNGIVGVGAWRADDHGLDSGAAYLFDTSTGNQLDKLLPDTGNNYQTFGVSIAVDAGIVAVGSRTFFVLGDGYTFAKVHIFDASSGNLINELLPDFPNYNGDLGGHFADCIDMDDGLIAVGVPNRSVFFDFSGAAYVFNVSTGQQLHFIYPADGHDRDHFGKSISIDAGIIAIGANEDDDSGWSAGSAYLYNATDGTQLDKLLISDGAQFDLFGSSIAIENGLVASGAIGYGESGDETGYVGVFGSGSGSGLAAISDLAISVSSGETHLDWSAVPDATSYRVERSTSLGSPWYSLGVTTETAWIDMSGGSRALFRVIAIQ